MAIAIRIAIIIVVIIIINFKCFLPYQKDNNEKYQKVL
jgi:hypothetical protein